MASSTDAATVPNATLIAINFSNINGYRVLRVAAGEVLRDMEAVQ